MLLRAFVRARNVRDGNDDGDVVEEEFHVSGWGKSRGKIIENVSFIFEKLWNFYLLCICKLESFDWKFVVVELYWIVEYKIVEIIKYRKKRE